MDKYITFRLFASSLICAFSLATSSFAQQSSYSVSDKLTLQAPFKLNFTTKDSVSIAYLPPATEYNFYLNLGNALQAAALKSHFSFEMKAPQSGEDWQLHAAMIEETIRKGVDVIVFSSFLPQTEKAIAPIIKRAVDNGIILINVNSDDTNLPYPVHAVIGVQQRRSTRRLAQHAARIIQPDRAKVAIIEGEPGQFSTERVGGFMEGINNTDLQVVASVNGHWNAVGGYKATLEIMRDNPEVAGIFAANDFEIMGASSALRILGRQEVLLFGYDGVEDALEMIATNSIAATTMVNAQRQGETVHSVLMDIVKGHFHGGFVEVPSEIVSQDNVMSFLNDAQKQSLRIEVENVSLTTELPHSSVANNSKDLAIELIREVYEPLGIKVNVRFVPYKRAEHMVSHNLADAMLHSYRGHPAGLLVPQWHYAVQHVNALFKKNKLDWQNSNSLIDKKVAWIRGYGFERYIPVDTLPVESTYRSSALRMLAKDRIEVYIDDKVEIIKASEALQGEFDLSQYQFAHLATLKLYPAFSTSAKGRKLARIYDQRMPILLYSGRLEELYKKWDYRIFPFDK